ncbi:uncharacterized protein LOC108627374 [Ceratina calcarata]|uniref:Uncharacterized protein LOC108627374 n=1 Tax=Ceratina calcarata TaxID=156304 RepID=A0AAJ7J4K6_9HYME|nr:uncharacterized protein LOC108627374 [Ceratina calcarata]
MPETVFLDNPGQASGKLAEVSQAEAIDDTPKKRRLTIRDRYSCIEFLIDTGADVSVFPMSFKGKGAKDDVFKLYAVNGATINTYGERLLSLNLGLRRNFSWRFIVADVSKPIIGADFLHFYNLLVDLRNRRLLDGNTKLFQVATVVTTEIPSISTTDANSTVTPLLREFIEITQATSRKNVKHDVFHHIITKGAPIAERARRLPPEKLKIA